MVSQHQNTAKPQYDDDHTCAKELAERVSGIVTDIHTHDIATVGGVDAAELIAHLVFCTEGLDDAKAA